MRFVSKEYLLAKLSDLKQNCSSSSDIEDIFFHMRDIIDYAPTEYPKIEGRLEAHWEILPDGWLCSNCKKFTIWGKVMPEMTAGFCPNCGADMRGDSL